MGRGFESRRPDQMNQALTGRLWAGQDVWFVSWFVNGRNPGRRRPRASWPERLRSDFLLYADTGNGQRSVGQ